MRSKGASPPKANGPARATLHDSQADQRRIRPTRPIQDLSEFLAFLEEFEALFGPTAKPRRAACGGRFLL